MNEFKRTDVVTFKSCEDDTELIANSKVILQIVEVLGNQALVRPILIPRGEKFSDVSDLSIVNLADIEPLKKEDPETEFLVNFEFHIVAKTKEEGEARIDRLEEILDCLGEEFGADIQLESIRSRERVGFDKEAKDWIYKGE